MIERFGIVLITNACNKIYPRGLISLGVSGSNWVEVEQLEKKPIKAYHGHCFLLDQSMDILEKIFLWLSPRDLALLCLASKSLNRLVIQFIEHRISSQDLTEKMSQFFAANELLLLPKEIILRDRVANNSRPQLLLYSAMRQFLGPVRRVSLAEEFSRQNGSRGNDVIRERDVSLKRDVIVFKRSCHSLKFVHTFKSIPPGKYTVQVIKILEAFVKFICNRENIENNLLYLLDNYEFKIN